MTAVNVNVNVYVHDTLHTYVYRYGVIFFLFVK